MPPREVWEIRKRETGASKWADKSKCKFAMQERED
jgi:hypothetical protein